MSSLEKLGISAKEYMAARRKTRSKKGEYTTLRDQFLFEEGLMFAEAMTLPEFHEVTGDAYKEYQKAKREEYNALRRMETQYRRCGGEA